MLSLSDLARNTEPQKFLHLKTLSQLENSILYLTPQTVFERLCLFYTTHFPLTFTLHACYKQTGFPARS